MTSDIVNAANTDSADSSLQVESNHSIKKIIFVVIGLVLLFAVFALFIVQGSDNIDPQVAMVDKTIDPSSEISPTPFPFAQLTIPYLRSQTFESELSDLEEISNNANYTTYITSFISEGLKINGLLTIPEEVQPTNGFPAIVFLHGYIPPASYNTLGPQYSDYVDYLARSGFVVFKIDLRGHGDSEGEAGGAYFAADYIVDTLHAYSALQKASFVNSEKVGLWGHSMAGNVVFRSLVTKQDIPAIVIWSGAVYTYKDMRKYGIQDNSYQRPPTDSERSRDRDRMREIHGDPADGGEYWDMVAPTNYLRGVIGAIQINHAVDDAVVDIGYSRDLISLLDDTDIPHELHEYNSGGHNISGASFVRAMENTVEFYNKYLNAK
jgi:uncharacterized protein